MLFGPPKKVEYPKSIPPNIEEIGLETYIISLRIEELTKKLKSPLPPPHLRSNDDPLYYLNKYEFQKQQLINEALTFHPDQRCPTEYRQGARYSEKVYIPASEFPEINFIGLIIGPRGTTLKSLESEARVKLSIKGKGIYTDTDTDPLYCLVAADTQLDLYNGVVLVENIIESAIDIPEVENKLKTMQLRELAVLNGTVDSDSAVFSRSVLSDWEKYYYWWYFYNS